MFDEASGRDTGIISSELISRDKVDSSKLDSEKINLIIQSVKENTNNDSEKMFSSLEKLLLTYDRVNPQTLVLIIKKIDFNNQVEQSTFDVILSELKMNQEIDSNILIKSLNGLIYNDSMFNGSELSLDAVVETLFSQFEKIEQNKHSEQEQFGLPHNIISV